MESYRRAPARMDFDLVDAEVDARRTEIGEENRARGHRPGTPRTGSRVDAARQAPVDVGFPKPRAASGIGGSARGAVVKSATSRRGSPASGERESLDPGNSPFGGETMQDDVQTSRVQDIRKTAEIRVPSSLLRETIEPVSEIALLVPVRGRASHPIALEDDETVIGRLADASAMLRDESVSRRHARVLRQDDEFVLEDLGSSHGTYVDGVPIVACVLRDGDFIQVGQSIFGFCRQVQYLPPGSKPGGRK